MKIGSGDGGAQGGVAEFGADGIEVSLWQKGVGDGSGFGEEGRLDDGERGAELGGSGDVASGEECAQEIDGLVGKGAKLVADEVGVELFGALEGEAEMGLGAAPVMDGGAMESDGFCGVGHSGSLDQGGDDTLLDGGGFCYFEFDGHRFLHQEKNSCKGIWDGGESGSD